MSIDNAFASVAVTNLETSAAWYAKLLGSNGSRPMPEVIEWKFANGGGLQVYLLAERAGKGSCTLAVRDIEAEIKKLDALGIDTKKRTSNDRVKTVMIKDPDGNSLALAEASDPSLMK